MALHHLTYLPSPFSSPLCCALASVSPAPGLPVAFPCMRPAEVGYPTQAPGAKPVFLQPRDPVSTESQRSPLSSQETGQGRLRHLEPQCCPGHPSLSCHVVSVPLPCLALLSRPSRGQLCLMPSACFCTSPVTLTSSHHASTLARCDPSPASPSLLFPQLSTSSCLCSPSRCPLF